MNKVKVENYLREWPDSAFPAFRELSSEECRSFRVKIASVLGLGPGVPPIDIVSELHSRSQKRLGKVGRDGTFALKTLLRDNGIADPTEAMINWHRFDEIDRMLLDNLSDNFGDIWYPATDDIEIFDHSCQWFLSVAHDGRISLIEP